MSQECPLRDTNCTQYFLGVGGQEENWEGHSGGEEELGQFGDEHKSKCIIYTNELLKEEFNLNNIF